MFLGTVRREETEERYQPSLLPSLLTVGPYSNGGPLLTSPTNKVLDPGLISPDLSLSPCSSLRLWMTNLAPGICHSHEPLYLYWTGLE